MCVYLGPSAVPQVEEICSDCRAVQDQRNFWLQVSVSTSLVIFWAYREKSSNNNLDLLSTNWPSQVTILKNSVTNVCQLH